MSNRIAVRVPSPQVRYVVNNEATETYRVTVRVPGPQGPAGLSGDGTGLSLSLYEHQQTVPSVEWIVNHNLNRKPMAQFYNVIGEIGTTEVVHQSVNQLRFYFAVPTIGTVVCT